MDTSCKNCVFAEWDGIQQIQCEFDRLEKFVERGTVVVEEEDRETGKRYFKILGRICNTCRHPSALEGVPARRWRQKVADETQVKISYIVYIGPDNTEVEVGNTVNSITNQVHARPFEIVFARDKARVTGSDLSEMMQDTGLTWRIVNVDGVMRPGNVYDPDPTFGDVIDEAVNTCKGMFYTVGRAGYEFLIEFNYDIDVAINVELVPFVAIWPDPEGNGGLMQVMLHKTVKGNRNMFGFETIYQKVADIARQEGTEYMIKTWGEIQEILNR
jgi:hypothetical protein